MVGIRRGYLFALIPAILAGCDLLPSEPPPAPVVTVVEARSGRSFLETLALSTPAPVAAIQVDYWAEGVPRLRKILQDPRTEEELLLTRLRAGMEYQFEVRAMNGGGQLGPASTGSFSTAPLPDSLAELSFTVEGTATNPLTMLEFSAVGRAGGYVIVDRSGQIVWSFGTPALPTASARLDNGNFVLLDRNGLGLIEVSPAGEVLARLPQGERSGRFFHHEVIRTARNTVLVLALETRTIGTRTIAGEAIWEWTPGADDAVKRWSSFDFLDPAKDKDWGPYSEDADWLHANALSIGPRGNILVSLRSLSQVLSISQDFKTLEWRAGGVNANIKAAPGAEWFAQHTVSELSPVNGRPRLLMFDNGFERTDAAVPYSRALEVELDFDSGTATKVWEFRPSPDNYASILGLTARLSNGNSFVHFGSGSGTFGSTGPIETYEVASDGRVVWRMVSDYKTAGMRVYRAYPLATIDGEVEVQE